jgi:hypothetical protein
MILFRHLRKLFDVARHLGAGNTLFADRRRDVVNALTGLRYRLGQRGGDTYHLFMCRLQGTQSGPYYLLLP